MPKAVFCYICGRGYGTKSIGIHLKACEKKWDVEQQNLPARERRKCPQAPKGFMEALSGGNITREALEEINNQGFDEYKYSALKACEFCNRTFNPESYKVHQRICTADKPFKPLPKNPKLEAAKENVEEKGARQTAPASAKIAPVGSAKMPQNSAQKGQPPREFSGTGVSGKGQGEKIEQKPVGPSASNQRQELPEECQEVGETGECSKCGRNFAVDRLAKHEKVCKVNSQPKKVKVFHQKAEKSPKRESEAPKWKKDHEDLQKNLKYMKGLKEFEAKGGDIRKFKAPPASTNPGYIECRSCGRKFNETAYERHSKVCANIVNKPKPLMRKS